MQTAYDISSSALLERLARYLKKNVKEVNPPAWSAFAKTGPSRKRPPHDPDWWYVRAASILRKLYMRGPLGTSRLRAVYGGRKDYSMRKAHKSRSGGSSIRKILQQLEQAGLVAHDKKGRFIQSEGRRLIDRITMELAKEVQSDERV